MRMRRPLIGLVILLTLALMVTACSFGRRGADPGKVEPPPGGDVSPGPGAQAEPGTALFFADWQSQHLVPEPRELPTGDGVDLPTEVVKALLAVSGPRDPHLFRTIPELVRLLQPVEVRDGLALVNLSREFADMRGATQVQMALGSLLLSLTELPGIERVQVLIEGQQAMIGEGTLLAPMDRVFLGDLVFFFDPDRAQYLDERFAQGIDPWRADAAQVLQWEGRMFGFTADELRGAKVEVKGDQAQASLGRNGKAYLIKLQRQGQIWVIKEIAA